MRYEVRSRRRLPLIPLLFIGLLCAAGTTMLGGGVWDPNDPTKLNPEAGILHIGGQKRCVVLQGSAFSAAAKPCGQPPGGSNDERWVESVEGTGALSRTEIEALWLGAGGNPGQARMASAVAMAESGWKPDALGRNPNGTVDRGIWQINSIHGARSTFDPRGNAAAAVAISSNGSNWTPWVTYNKGTHRQFL